MYYHTSNTLHASCILVYNNSRSTIFSYYHNSYLKNNCTNIACLYLYKCIFHAKNKGMRIWSSSILKEGLKIWFVNYITTRHPRWEGYHSRVSLSLHDLVKYQRCHTLFFSSLLFWWTLRQTNILFDEIWNPYLNVPSQDVFKSIWFRAFWMCIFSCRAELLYVVLKEKVMPETQ